MQDSDFKSLEHHCKGYKIVLKGGELSKGYKPDVVLKQENNYIILESEHSSSRKHILGGMVKAAKYLTGERKGCLVVVLQLKKNTTVDQIRNHLGQYLSWLKDMTNLKDVYVISDVNYCKNINCRPIELLSDKFNKSASKVESSI